MTFDKIIVSVFWGAYAGLWVTPEKNEALVAKLPELEAFMVKHMNGADYLGGTNEPMLLDIHVFPIVERLITIEAIQFKEAFDALKIKETCPQTYAYVHRFREHPLMKPHCMEMGPWKEQNALQLLNPAGVKKMLTVPGVLI